MRAEHRRVELSSLGRIVTGKTPPGSRSEYFGDAVPFVTPTDMDGRRCVAQTLRSLSTVGREKLARVIVPAGSVAVSCIGSQLGKAIFIRRESATNQQINTVVPDSTIVDSIYLYYFLSTQQAHLRSITSGSAQPIVNKTTFGRLEVPLPPIDEQRRIAAVLGALDDKIELNRRMNETLEGMARALFKSWFVDFDPVRAKMEGRAPYGMNADTAALFPDHFEDSELGPIPAGWGWSTIGDVLSVSSGKRQKDRRDAPTSGYRVPLLGGAGQIGWTSEYLHEGTIIVTGRVGTLGVVRVWSGPTWPSDNTLVVRERAGSPQWLHMARNAMSRVDFARLNRGSTQPLLTQRDLKATAVPVPCDQVRSAFDTFSEALLQRRVANEAVSRTLADLRDTLLPKLLSGELRVPEAEELVEDA